MNSSLRTLSLITLLFLTACKTSEFSDSPILAYKGATIIDGNGGDPIVDGILLVQDGRVVAVGTSDEIDITNRTQVFDVSGTFITPGIINAHGHVGNTKGIEGGHYSRDNVLENLTIYARYGVTTVVSLGDDQKEAVPLRHVNDSLATNRARLFIAGEVVTGRSSAEALGAVERNHHMGVDFMKIRVDDNLGTSEKMSEEVYRAVIERSHQLGYRIATHMYYLEDARKLLDAGSDLIAHSVRDRAVDQSFIDLLKQKGVGYCPTLTRELSTFVYGDTAEFFSDPFFQMVYDDATIQPLMDPGRQQQVRTSRNAQIYQQQLPVAMNNLKRLSDAGVPIVFGTDSGVPTRFMGYFEHVEMSMMADAGLRPMQIILSATKNAAQYMGLSNLGTLSKGNWADFIILNANPLDDIRNMRDISAVFIGGQRLK